MIGSEVLFNGKCNLYNYMYNIIPKLFGRENIIFSFRYNNIGKLIHNYKLYDSENVLFYEYKSLKTNAGDNLKDDLHQGDVFYVKLDKDYIKIKIELILAIKEGVSGSVACKLYNTFNSNFLCVKYIKKN